MMFRSIGRRLAILNAMVVLAVIAVVGLASYFFLASSTRREVDSELRERSAAVAQLWSDDDALSGTPVADGVQVEAGIQQPSGGRGDLRGDGVAQGADDGPVHEEDEAREVLRSGDTIAFALNRAGEVVSDLRGIEVPELPRMSSVDRALAGETVLETVSIQGEDVRLRTEPVYSEGAVIGAIQVGMGLGSNQRALGAIRMATIGGLLLGALLAIPSGWLLATRSMRPIREAFARQQSFVADASHELRTPLTLIRAEAEYLAQSPDLSPDERRDGELAIIRETDSMSRLASRLLTLARIEEDQHALEREPVDLAVPARMAAQRLAAMAEAKGVRLDVEIDAPVLAMADCAAIEQIVSILTENAIAYTPAGGSIVIRTSGRETRAALTVSDTGIGISRADQQLIFDRFYRSDPARTRSDGGAGIGLSIARELMQAQGGSISVESELGNGSIFTLLLPRAPGK